MIGKSRQQTFLIMNSLKKKEILLNPEGARQISGNGRTVSPRTWMVNPYTVICAPRKNEVKLDKLTMRLFQHSLKNLKDQNGKKANFQTSFLDCINLDTVFFINWVFWVILGRVTNINII
ncbi:hypothetical protein P4V01_32665 [Bacillus thuringiensis]|nr:hypothetical protein [Bacillus thuringiensis]